MTDNYRFQQTRLRAAAEPERWASCESPLRLHVLRSNPARALYLRLGFAVADEVPERVFMEYLPAAR